MSTLNLPTLLGSSANALPGGNVVSGVLSTLSGAFGAKHDYRAARADEIYSMIQHGEPYSLLAARIIYKQKTGSHSDAGRAEYSAKWNQLLAEHPQLAAQAAAAGGLDDPTPGVPNSGQYSGPLQSTGAPTNNGQNNVAFAAGQIQATAAGLGDDLANRLNPSGNYQSLPTDKTTLVILGLVIVAAVIFFARRK